MAVVQKSCIGLVALFLLFSSLALAQRDQGTLTGTVIRCKGAVSYPMHTPSSTLATGRSDFMQKR